ncbi:unnamed protein product [Boreogadus saida]
MIFMTKKSLFFLEGEGEEEEEPLRLKALQRNVGGDREVVGRGGAGADGADGADGAWRGWGRAGSGTA